ncbi:MAG: ABC transporter ATP-binding protein [Lachnospiraceae bacterium]|nr:ABC transporter ATP-binding protein [Lachnospiraceae bacterium]
MKLTRENIQAAVEETVEYLKAHGIDKKRYLRYGLLLEEILLDYHERLGETEFVIKHRARRKRIIFTLHVKGEEIDFLSSKMNIISEHLLSELDQPPVWTYYKGENIIIFVPLGILPDVGSMKYVWRYVIREKRRFIMAVILRLLNMLLMVAEPILTSWIIVAYTGSEIRRILYVAALLFAQAIINAAVSFGAGLMLRKSYDTLVVDMRNDLNQTVLETDTASMNEQGTGVFTERLISETANVIDGIDQILSNITEIFGVISLFIAFAVISVRMLLLEALFFMIYLFIHWRHIRQFSEDNRRCRSKNEQHSGFVGEMVRAHRDIKLLNCADSFLEKISKSTRENTELVSSMRISYMKYTLFKSEFIGIANFIYMAVLAFLMTAAGMAASTALVLFNYNGRVYSTAGAITGFYDSLISLSLASERVYQLLFSPEFKKERFGTVRLEEVRGEIEFRNVSFSYSHADDTVMKVFDGLNFRIKAGESVAFVGKSGCGKSTILSLIARLFDPGSGVILLDGINIEELDRDSLRGNIGMVSQTPYIFNMSVRDNLAIIRKDMTDEEMIRACRIACIHDEIMKMPHGYDSIVGEGGVTLSGGQRQRIALARSMLKDYPVIMLDEATSALDNVTQAKIQKAIETMNGKRTVIMVAHRLSTVIGCQRIFFLSGGRVIADGTHQELLEKCPEYRELYMEECIA